MDQAMLIRLWDESWKEGIWIAPWAKAVADLSPEQAAWKPMPDRHSIWQIVNHVAVWRECSMTTIDGRPGPVREDMKARNFEEPVRVDEEEWRKARERLQRTHDNIRAMMSASSTTSDRLTYHLGHDCYHLGQIMYLRAMQGLTPIE